MPIAVALLPMAAKMNSPSSTRNPVTDATSAKPPQAFSVTEINTVIADLLTSGLPGFLWVEGEVSNLSVATSGHRYLSLKDAASSISCALFRNTANRIPRKLLNDLKNGDKIAVKASVNVYKPRGSYQLIISDIETAGFGELAKAFAELKVKLDNAGLTAAANKRPIPTWPHQIAVVTSESGAAIRDVLTTLKRRAAFINISVYPTLVQGEKAHQQLIKALQQANDDADNEVILLVRGGGSLEDLAAFNHEDVALAVAKSRLPIVTGVGHETDFTIVDFVSDYRAATPTAAAEIVSPDKMSLSAALKKHEKHLQLVLQQYYRQRYQDIYGLQKRLQVQHPTRQLQLQNQRLDEASQRLVWIFKLRISRQQQQLTHLQNLLNSSSPKQQLSHSRELLGALQQRLQQTIQRKIRDERHNLQNLYQKTARTTSRIRQCQQQLKGMEARLTLLSPLGILARGYSLTFDEGGQLLYSVNSVDKKSKLTVRLADGELTAVVQEIKNSQSRSFPPTNTVKSTKRQE